MMPELSTIAVGDCLPERNHKPDVVQLFLFNAVIWNPHRIHYDYPYATRTEDYPAIVIDGPLQADWLAQAVMAWLGEAGRLVSFKYSNRKAAFVGETLYSSGSIAAINVQTGEVTLSLQVRNEAGKMTTPATAVVVLPVV